MSIKSINVNTVNDIKDALEEARKAVLSGDFSEVQVIFAEGEYNITQIYLNEQNSGTKSCPIRFIADGKASFLRRQSSALRRF